MACERGKRFGFREEFPSKKPGFGDGSDWNVILSISGTDSKLSAQCGVFSKMASYRGFGESARKGEAAAGSGTSKRLGSRDFGAGKIGFPKYPFEKAKVKNQAWISGNRYSAPKNSPRKTYRRRFI
ncbi:MAG: hypothetical protein ACLFQQ_20650 [Desulfococcaceae bacterium]